MTVEPVAASPTGVRINLRVTTRASRNAVGGVHAGRVQMRVTAPPVDGAANAAVIALIAETLGVAKSRVFITAGETSRNKSVTISAVSVPAVWAAFGLSGGTEPRRG